MMSCAVFAILVETASAELVVLRALLYGHAPDGIHSTTRAHDVQS